MKSSSGPSYISAQLITDYINTILSSIRDNPELRLNLVMRPKSSVVAEQVNPTVTSGIMSAMQLNQWLVASTLCQLNVMENFHLPTKVMLNLLCRTLQTHDKGELSETMMILQRHLFLHPPSYPDGSIRQAYLALLVRDCREILDGDNTIKEGFIMQILNHLHKICRQPSDSGTISNDSDEDCDVAQLPLSELVLAMEACQVYSYLSAEEKLFRLQLTLDYSVSVLEQDFLAWHCSRPKWTNLGATLHSSKRRPLIVELAWPRVFDWRIGACNAFCRRVAHLLWLGKLQQPLLRLMALLAESISISECEGKFPALGKQCCTLAREVSLGMSQEADEFVYQANQLRPDWLALLVMHQAISKVVQPGNLGMPSLDLVEACMGILDNDSVQPTNDDPSDEIDLDLAEPTTKINKRDRIGETPLHKACKKGDAARVSQLLRQPHVNVNAADNAGWTPLHEAAGKGAVDCVRVLLKYRSATGITVDLRAKSQEGVTPLMDAVTANKPDICSLLLNYAGWCLLEDAQVNGSKAEDLAATAEVRAVLAASRMGKRSLMFNNLTCVDLPKLATLLPAYFKHFLSTYQVHLISRKASHGDPPSSTKLHKDKSFDYSGISRCLKTLKSIKKAAKQGSDIERILRGSV